MGFLKRSSLLLHPHNVTLVIKRNFKETFHDLNVFSGGVTEANISELDPSYAIAGWCTFIFLIVYLRLLGKYRILKSKHFWLLLEDVLLLVITFNFLIGIIDVIEIGGSSYNLGRFLSNNILHVNDMILTSIIITSIIRT